MKVYESSRSKGVKRREVIFGLSAAVFVLHFVMTLLHNTPEKYLTSRMESYSHLWCYPVFHQGWALFAPDPQDMTKHLDMRFLANGQWGDWYRAEDICMDQHLKYRLSHYSKLCHVAQNATYHLWLELDKYERQDLEAESYFPMAQGFGIGAHFAKSYAYHFLAELRPDSIKMRLVLEDPFELDEPQLFTFPTYSPDVR